MELTISSERLAKLKQIEYTPAPQRSTAMQIFKEETRAIARTRAQEVIDQIAEESLDSVRKMSELKRSKDENIVYKASKFFIEHTIGTPLNKSVSRVENVNIDVLAD